MTDITVIKHLCVLGIVSVILNSMSVVILFAGYTTVVVIYGIDSDSVSGEIQSDFYTFAAVVEFLCLLATVISSILTLVGSCLAMVPNKRIRKAGLVSSIAAVWTLSIHIIINIFVMVLTFVLQLSNTVYTVCGSVLVCIVVLQLFLLLFNSIFICVVGKSLRKVEIQNY